MWQLAPGTEIRWQGEYGDNGPAPALGRSKTGVPSSLGPYLFFTSVVTYSNGEKNFSFE